MNSDELQEWLMAIIKGIVSYPESIEIMKKSDEMGVLYTVKVHAEDRGKVIGKQGRVAGAIRDLLRSAGGQNRIRTSMKIDVPDSEFKTEGE